MARQIAPEVPHPELFQPIKIGNCQIDNRIVMAPMNVLMSSGNNGLVTDQNLAYYAARARGGTGLIISECVLGTKLASRFPYTSNLHLFNTTHLAGLEELTETVHAFDSKIFIQLSIGFGRQGHNPDHESPPAPSAIPYRTEPAMLPKVVVKNSTKELSWFLHPETPFATRPDMPREMTREEIHSEIEEYGRSCRLAVVAGFDGLEIHAPHGYLEHQFLSPRSNKRTDEYGGSLENRMRFLLECYDAARDAIGDAIPIGVRLSGDEHMPEGIHHDELKIVVKTLGERGIDYVHLSDGSYEALKYFFPEKDGTMLEPAESFKSVLPDGVPVICVSIHKPAAAAEAIRDGPDRHGLPGAPDAGRSRLRQQGARRREIRQVRPLQRVPASHRPRADGPLLDESQSRPGALHARVPPARARAEEAASAEVPPGDSGTGDGEPAGNRGSRPEDRRSPGVPGCFPEDRSDRLLT